MAGRGSSGSGSRAYRQLLLLAALLFGIVTMHTVGHPAEHGGREAAASSGSVAMSDAVYVSGAVAMPVAMDGAASDDGHPSPDHAPLSGMDPLSVCLAVLGAWGLALIGVWLSGLRADGRGLGTPVGAGVLRVLRPDPPPPISVLASVSVLRI